MNLKRTPLILLLGKHFKLQDNPKIILSLDTNEKKKCNINQMAVYIYYKLHCVYTSRKIILQNKKSPYLGKKFHL